MLGMFPNEAIKIIPDKIWCDSFFTCFVNVCLDPQQIGFNLNDLEVYTNLPMKTRAFLKLFTQHFPQHIQNRFRHTCTKLIDDSKRFQALVDSIQAMKKSSNDSSESTNTPDWLKLSQIVNGYEQLSEFNMYAVSSDFNRIIFDYIIASTSNSSNAYEQESLSCVEAKRKLLNFCLNLNFMALKKSAPNVTDVLIEILDKFLFLGTDPKILTLFTYYKSEVCAWVCKRYDSILKYIMNKLSLNFAKCISLLVSLIEYLATEKHLRKTYGVKIVHFLYENWSLFREYWQPEKGELENKMLLINLLTKCCFVELVPFEASPKMALNLSEMYMNMLVDTKTKLNFKCRVLDLLYVFCESPAPYQIKNYLSQFITQFPLKSTELVKGEDIYNDYLNAVRKMLVSLELSSSLDLASIVINILCRETKHICDEEIQQSLVNFIKRLDCGKQSSVITLYWENSFKKGMLI